MSDDGQQQDEASGSSPWQPGDRVWLLPDTDKREVKSQQPGVVESVLPSGRVKVIYIEHGCKLRKTVEPKRIRHRDLICLELRERA